MIVVKVTEQATRVGMARPLPWEGATEERESASAATREYHMVVVRISLEVPQHQIPSAIDEGSGQLAARAPTAVRIGVQVVGKI